MTDPFAAPAPIPSSFPTVASFRGRLVLIKALRQETVPNSLGGPGAVQERVTADVTVVDGLGPVPVMKQNVPTGQTLEGPEFKNTWLTGQVVTQQLADAVRTGVPVLGRIDTQKPGGTPMKGNPWGIISPTEEDKNTARQFLAARMVGSAAAPAAVPQAPPLPAPGSAAPGSNPFA